MYRYESQLNGNEGIAGQHLSSIMVMSLRWQDTSFDGNSNG